MNMYRFVTFRDLSNFVTSKNTNETAGSVSFSAQPVYLLSLWLYQERLFWFFRFSLRVYFGALSGCVFFVFERTTGHIFWHRTYFWEILFRGLISNCFFHNCDCLPFVGEGGPVAYLVAMLYLANTPRLIINVLS